MLPFVVVALTALIGATALAFDLGRLNTTATEVQGVADAAALGAIAASQFTPGTAATTGPARASAIAARNRAGGQPGAVASADVQPAWYSQRDGTTTAVSYSGAVNAVVVTARARTSYAFAGALGLVPPTVTRRATAWIGNMQGAACLRPLALPYTRIYEDANSLTSRPYSSLTPPQYAPTMNQTQVAQYSRTDASARTFVTVPPWQKEANVDTSGGGHPNVGAWHTADFGALGWAMYEQNISAPTGGATCAAAATSVGAYLYPFTWHLDDSTAILARNARGFLLLCNQTGGGSASTHSATCRNSDGSVGVSTRAAFTDSIPKTGGSFSQRVRMVSQVRIMCYYVYTTDRCPAAQVSNGAGGTVAWHMPVVWVCDKANDGSANCASSGAGSYQVVDTGYPRGTMVVMLDGPVYGDLTPDVTLGDSLSFTQRLVLVR